MNVYTLLGEFAGLAKFMLKAQRIFPDQVQLSPAVQADWKEQIARYDQFMKEKVKKADAVEVPSCQPSN